MKLRHVLPFTAAFLAVAFAATFASCNRENSGGTNATSARAGSGGTEIILVNNKIEIDEPLRAFAALYEGKTGVKVTVRSFGGETPYAPSIAAMFQAGVEPEIFVIEGVAGYEDAMRGGRITDLSGEPWVQDTDLYYVSPTDNSIVGFPVAIEGWGLAYNKELLQKAGVDPASMTNISGMRAAFAKIESMKAELGIDAAVSMTAGSGMTWVTGLHGMNSYLALGLPYYDSARYIDMLNNGQVDTQRLTYFAEYMDLLFRNSVRSTLTVGGYDQQLGDFVTGRTVFLHQGNWVDPALVSMGANFEMGFVPHAFLPETTDGIFIGAPAFYIVNARSANSEEAKKFLNFMASSPEGHDYMVNKAGMVPAFRSVELSPSGPLSKAVQEWAESGRMFAWRQNEMPDGFGMQVLGPIFGQLALQQIGTGDFVRLFTDAVATLR